MIRLDPIGHETDLGEGLHDLLKLLKHIRIADQNFASFHAFVKASSLELIADLVCSSSTWRNRQVAASDREAHK